MTQAMTTIEPDGVEVERATHADAAIVDTMVREIAAHQDQLEAVRTTSARWADLLHRPDVIVLIARRAGEPIGYVSAIRRLHLWSGADVLALDDLYVREGARNGGVGRLLMNELASRYAAPDRLTITWGVEPTNEAALRFYRRLGASLRTKVVASWRPTPMRDTAERAASGDPPSRTREA